LPPLGSRETATGNEHEWHVKNMDNPAIVVRLMADSDSAAWDKFVADAEGSTFFHRSGWRTIFEDVFRLQSHYLVAERLGRIVGVLPLVHQKTFLFGNALIAAPFCVEGGPLSIDEEVASALDAAAIALMEQTRAAYIEYRSRKATRPSWAVKGGLYATFERPISADDNANLLAIPRKQRAVVRKTLEGSLKSEVATSADALFGVYSESVRNLGTPTFPKRYFSALLRTFRDACDVVVVYDGSKPISSVMNFYFRDTVMPYYGGGTSEARRNGANDFLYWEVMRRAARKGCKRFDFGRSKAGTGAFAFKKNWGFEPQWLEYEYWLKPGSILPAKDPTNPRYSLLIEAWKRLPLPIANVLGPILIRGLG
jgi:FemAB-related protein (PEP-CTERM system-associated)